MIQLENLTPEQVEMLDIMWSLETYEDYTQYLESLDAADRRMAESLAQMVVLAEMDNLIGDCNEAKDLLKNFAL
jgi:hypothetical protein